MKVLNDLLWNGDLKIYQNDENFMYSLDSLLLSKFVTINDSVKNILDIGTGNAPIPLILSKRSNAFITGVEIQKESYDLALESINLNKLESRIKIINEDINNIYENLDNNYYDVITCNPPYYRNDMLKSENISKSLARSEVTLTLDDVFKVSKKVLKNRGRIAIVNRPERLVDIIVCMKKYGIEPKKIRFVYPKIGKPANHVLIEGMKNGSSFLNVMEPLIIHNEDDTYTKDAIDMFII